MAESSAPKATPEFTKKASFFPAKSVLPHEVDSNLTIQACTGYKFTLIPEG